MIPNVFVSSTIADLHYLRDAIREAIADLSYNPVMSDYGGVGYISQGTASDACYVTVKQCQLAILIIGKRYGTPKDDGLSVTHTEFITARENEVPLITFVDAEVISYKKVYDADPESGTWEKFPHMDHPRMTFKLVDEVVKSANYNGMIAFTSASEAKTRLKQQVAHYIGDRLSGVVRPIKSDVNEILAEVKTLRNLVAQIQNKGGAATAIIKGNDIYYTALRFLLDERRNDYTKFVEVIFGDLDVAVKHIVTASDFEGVIKRANATIEIIENSKSFRDLFNDSVSNHSLRYSSEGQYGSWAFFEGNRLAMTKEMLIRLQKQQESLQAKLAMSGIGTPIYESE